MYSGARRLLAMQRYVGGSCMQFYLCICKQIVSGPMTKGSVTLPLLQSSSYMLQVFNLPIGNW